MSWPSPPYPFGGATSPEPMSSLDTMFNQTGAMIAIPCTPSGTNAISLSPNVNCPALTAYNELGGYRFVALNTSTGPVTAQYNGLGFLPVYHADGVTQAATADIVAGQQYIFTFHQALNGGVGGFYFEAPSQASPAATWFTPGGRLTFQSSTPVMFTTVTAPQVVYYAPYQHPFVPIFNGSAVQMTQFTSSLADTVGLQISLAGNPAWPISSLFDVFVTLNGGVPVLATVQWTNTTTRSLGLALFGGFLTNSGSATMRISTASTISVPANQATFLGTIATPLAQGQGTWQFPANNTSGMFALSNYYNPVLFTGFVLDSEVGYTYSSGTVRQAGAQTYNQIALLQTSSERAMYFQYVASIQTVGVVGANMRYGIGFNSTSSFAVNAQYTSQSTIINVRQAGSIAASLSFTGYVTAYANEGGDSVNANTFNINQANQLFFQAWL